MAKWQRPRRLALTIDELQTIGFFAGIVALAVYIANDVINDAAPDPLLLGTVTTLLLQRLIPVRRGDDDVDKVAPQVEREPRRDVARRTGGDETEVDARGVRSDRVSRRRFLVWGVA